MKSEMRFLIKFVSVVLAILFIVLTMFVKMLQCCGISEYWVGAPIGMAMVLTWLENKYWL